MAHSKTSNARRKEVRRNLPKVRPLWQELIRRKEVAWAALYVAVFALVAAVIAAPVRDRRPALQPGQVALDSRVSRVDFKVVDEVLTEMDRREAAKQVPPQFAPNTDQYDRLRRDLATLPAIASDAQAVDQIPEALRERLALTPQTLNALREQLNPDGSVKGQWIRTTQDIVDELYHTTLVDPADLERVIHDNPHHTLRIQIEQAARRPGEQQYPLKYRAAIFDLSARDPVTTELHSLVNRCPDALQGMLVSYLMDGLEPTYRYDDNRTAAARKVATDAVPRHIESVAAGQVIVTAGDLLSNDQIARVEAEHRAYLAARSGTGKWLPRAGLLGLLLIFGIGVWAYFFAYCPRLVRNPMRGGAITALMLLCLSVCVFTSALWPEFTLGAVTFPALFMAVVLAIAYDQRFALAVGGAMSVMAVMALRLPLESAVIVLAGIGVAVLQLREIRSRSKLVIIGVYAGLAMAAAAAVVALATRPVHLPGVPWMIFIDAASAFFAGFFTGLLVQGILPLIERAFNVTTAMTLRELNDASHPLLKRVAHEAAGTYQHSLRIADMAEAAAEAIGADGLLCRVGAMYHDIGKTNKPQYFIENQGGGPNKHANLSPAMSLLIIVGHVKDGVEMAREFALPPVIRHFIESHHGTTLVEYFYHEAKKQNEEADQPTPSEFEFRYPGPKPRTKEAAIMMICDAVEGAARAMDDPTASRLENLVRTMANKRLMDGQFDDCDLTLQDLSRIEKAVTKSLCAMYHSRIKYPEDERAPISA